MKHRMKAALAAMGSLCALLGSAQAQTAGPDVIVGDLYDWANWTSTAPVNGKRAYSVGTISCNLGDTPLTWDDTTTVYPVISGNMYRLMDGRFEQIGQSWLKHAFCALQGTVCGTCTPGGNCDALFPGCSDPYSASLNGSQGGLGPKWEVNAATGVFPLNWTSAGQVEAGDTQQALYKRIQCLDSNLGNPGALYFTSSTYIQVEDAAAGNDNNNQSYRRITINATNKNATLVDTTQRTKPAIFAWKDHGLGVGQSDPNVYLTAVDVPNDGRFWVGAKARDLGNGQWRYEYAVQNLNSDRSGASFSIPLPPGAVVSNTGFGDVFFHSGERQNGADWTTTVSGSSITWAATQTHAQNAYGNAITWDTVFNFWFDANVPPSGGSASMALFKPGTPTSMTFGTVVPSPDGVFHPLNDLCVNAAVVSAGATTFSNQNADTDGPTECTNANYAQIGSDIWFQYTSGSCTTGPTVIGTCGSGFDTKIAVYQGGCPTSPGTAVQCNDDSTVCGTSSLQSSVSFTAAANTTYLIRVGGYNDLEGTGTLTITPPSCEPPPPTAPENDLCANAIWLSDNVAVNGTNVAATNDGTATCGNSASSPDVWYKYRPTSSASVVVSTCDSVAPLYDTVISVYTGVCGGFTQVACNDDSCSLRSSVTVAMTANTTYYIRVAGYNNATGQFKVKATGGGGVIPPNPPANDNCANRAGLGIGASAFTTVAATTDGPTHNACNFNGSNQITNDVWFNHPSTWTGNLKIDTCTGGGFDTKLAVYSGNGCTDFETRLMACNDNDACSPGRSSVTVPVVAGQNYTIRIGGFNGASGVGTITLTQLASCGSADFDGDGDTGTDSDIEAFFACLGGNCCQTCGSADFDGDGDTGTDADIEAFFRVLGGGNC